MGSTAQDGRWLQSSPQLQLLRHPPPSLRLDHLGCLWHWHIGITSWLRLSPHRRCLCQTDEAWCVQLLAGLWQRRHGGTLRLCKANAWTTGCEIIVRELLGSQGVILLLMLMATTIKQQPPQPATPTGLQG